MIDNRQHTLIYDRAGCFLITSIDESYFSFKLQKTKNKSNPFDLLIFQLTIQDLTYIEYYRLPKYMLASCFVFIKKKNNNNCKNAL